MLNRQHWNLDIAGFGEALQMTRYEGGDEGHYDWHQDFGATISRKLSIVVQLTDPDTYEGGDLQIMTSHQPINVERKRGLVAVFPSFQLHRVTPVTSGDRHTLVAWMSGPRFR
jgi:PKHD-type hydroxylase